MYQIAWRSRVDNDQGFLIGNEPSIFLVWHYYLGHFNHFKVVITSLGVMPYEVQRDGKEIPWYK